MLMSFLTRFQHRVLHVSELNTPVRCTHYIASDVKVGIFEKTLDFKYTPRK